MFIFTIFNLMPVLKNKIHYLLVFVLAILYCYIEAQGKGDFYIFLSAAENLTLKNNIYEISYLDSYNYFYSVIFAAILSLFTALPFFWVKFFWLLLNLSLFIHLFALLAQAPIVKALQVKKRRIFLAFVGVFSFRFLHENIHTSQITILILWCCIFGLYLIEHHRWLLGGAILALGINIKLLPIVFLPYLVYRGYFKAATFTVLIYVLSLFAPSVFIGADYNIGLLKSWIALINPLQQRHILDVDERSFHSLSTLLSTLLVKNVPDLYAMHLKRNLMDISLQSLSTVLLIMRLLLVALTLYFLKWKPFIKAGSVFNGLLEKSYILLLIPLIFPHQQHYAFLFTVPAFGIILLWLLSSYDRLSKYNRVTLIASLILVYLTGNLKILLGEFNDYYEHYKILTYGSLLLVTLLIWVSHKNKALPLEILEN